MNHKSTSLFWVEWKWHSQTGWFWERPAWEKRPGAQDAKPGVMDEPEEFEGKAKRQNSK